MKKKINSDGLSVCGFSNSFLAEPTSLLEVEYAGYFGSGKNVEE